VNLTIGAVALWLLVRDLREQVERRSHRVDYAGAVLVLVAAGLLILGLLQGGTAWPWLSVPSVLVFAIAVLATALLVVVERRAAEPMMPPWLWSQRLMAGSFIATIVAGLLVIGLSTFLPTYAQAVLGLDPVAAGFVLAVMSVTWPLAATFSSRVYLRIGFRDTSLVGAGLCIAAGVALVALTAAGPVWLAVLGSALMGAGLGLITTALLVGLQATVGWSQRGVVTGGAMFSRFLGQSLGAAVFGAITNAVLLQWLLAAPAALTGRVPARVDQVSETLAGGHPDPDVAAYLQDALQASTHAVFVGLLVAAVATAVLLLALVPRRFPLHQEAVADVAAPQR
jgi:Na+/melibiose symporter-like transporter